MNLIPWKILGSVDNVRVCQALDTQQYLIDAGLGIAQSVRRVLEMFPWLTGHRLEPTTANPVSVSLIPRLHFLDGFGQQRKDVPPDILETCE
jgi:hypothetical protein